MTNHAAGCICVDCEEEARTRAVLTNHEKRQAREDIANAREFLARAQRAVAEAEYLRADGADSDAQWRHAEAMSLYMSALVNAVLSVTDTLRGSRKTSWT